MTTDVERSDCVHISIGALQRLDHKAHTHSLYRTCVQLFSFAQIFSHICQINLPDHCQHCTQHHEYIHLLTSTFINTSAPPRARSHLRVHPPFAPNINCDTDANSPCITLPWPCRLCLAKASSFNGDLSKWDVSSVISMESMFAFAKSFNDDLSE